MGIGNKASSALRVVIIDDEPHCIDALTYLIGSIGLPVVLEGSARTLESGVELVRRVRPDLIFLDVEIGDQLGFELYPAISDLETDIIFTTGYSKYAMQAIKVSALDFLLKPVEEDELRAAILKKENRDLNLRKKMEVLRENLEKKELSRMAIPTLKGFEFVELAEVQYCLAEDNYTQVHLSSGKHLLVSRTLKKLEEMLDSHRFFRVNRSTVINLDFLKSYVRGKTPSVSLDNGLEFSLSPSRKDEFLQRINHL